MGKDSFFTNYMITIMLLACISAVGYCENAGRHPWITSAAEDTTTFVDALLDSNISLLKINEILSTLDSPGELSKVIQLALEKNIILENDLAAKKLAQAARMVPDKKTRIRIAKMFFDKGKEHLASNSEQQAQDHVIETMIEVVSYGGMVVPSYGLEELREMVLPLTKIDTHGKARGTYHSSSFA